MKLTLYFLLFALLPSVCYAQKSRLLDTDIPINIKTSFENQVADISLNLVQTEYLHNENLARTGAGSLLLNGKISKAYFTLAKLMPVTANERITMQLYANCEKVQKQPINTVLTAGTAIVTSGQSQNNFSGGDRKNQQLTSKRFPYISAGIVFTPSMLKHLHGLPKAYLKYIIYSKDTVEVKTAAIGLDKSAIGGWQELVLKVVSPVNGYVQVLFVNESNQQVYVDDFAITDEGKEYKGAIASHLALSSYGGCANVCGHTESTYLYTVGSCAYYQVCYYTVDCSTGETMSGWSCETECQGAGNPDPGPGTPGGGGNGGGDTGGGTSGPPPPNPCPGSAYVDDCGVCVGGNTGLTATIWYMDGDMDGWGESAVTIRCHAPGAGWSPKGGDPNDGCYNTNNDPDQCQCSSQSSISLQRDAVSSYPLDPGDWGVTPVESIEVEIDACQRGGNVWIANVTAIIGHYSKVARLLSGISEVTGPAGNTTSSNYCDQVIDLLDLGYQSNAPSQTYHWYMLGAVEAHEAVHETHLYPSLQNAESYIKSIVNVITIPYTGQSRAAAIQQIKSSGDFSNALFDAKAYWESTYKILWTPDHDFKTHNGPTDVAERSITIPMIHTICNYATNSAWPYCTACP